MRIALMKLITALNNGFVENCALKLVRDKFDFCCCRETWTFIWDTGETIPVSSLMGSQIYQLC